MGAGGPSLPISPPESPWTPCFLSGDLGQGHQHSASVAFARWGGTDMGTRDPVSMGLTPFRASGWWLEN